LARKCVASNAGAHELARAHAARAVAFAPHARRRGAELTLWLPRLPRAEEGPNGRAWRTRSRATKAWHELVLEALSDLEEPVPAWRAARITYEVHRPGGRAFDPDNVIALMKPVQDAIVAAGVLPDDSAEHVVATPTAVQLVSPLPFGFVVVRVRRA
jgi:hypothetical protein